jgi:hypothetical protein
MAIRPVEQSVPTKLPAAKLYLDDISQICAVLKDSAGQDFRTTFTVDDSQVCETVEDLKERGGRATQFEIRIASEGREYTVRIRHHASELNLFDPFNKSMAWAKYAKVESVFRKRKKNLVLRCLIYGAVWILMYLYLAHWLNGRFPFAVSAGITFVTAMLIGPVTGWYIIPQLFGSVVYMRYSHEAGTGRWLDEHKSELIVGIVCAALGAIATRIVEKVWK